MGLEEIGRALLSVYSSVEQLQAATSELTTLLQSCQPASGEALRRETFSRGVVNALLGILRCSSDTHLLAKGATCIAAIAFDSDESRSRLARTDVIPVLLRLISPQSDQSDRNKLVWQKKRIPVYEQVLNALRKLTYLSLDNQQVLLQQGGIKLIVELCTNEAFFKSSCGFSPEAKQQLIELAVGKKLFCQSSQAPLDIHAAVLSSFPPLTTPFLSRHYPSYLVNLATPDQKWISSAMIASGSVWPDLSPLPTSCRTVMTCVYATHVEDAGHLWCQFCAEKPQLKVQKMCSSLRNLPPPPISIPPTLTVGDVYAAYVDPTRCPAHSCGCVRVPQWCRARLLEEEEEEEEGVQCVEVFIVDFGFTVSVPRSSLAPIPPECRGIPPQAVPCKLVGVAPIPSSLVILENGAAILRNMSFEKDAFRKEIKVFRGIEALLQLSQCPHDVVCEQALGALINMAVSMEMRREMGQLGAVQAMLSLSKKWSSDPNHLLLVLGCLQNLVHSCPENVISVFDNGGHRVLVAMLLGNDCVRPDVREKVRVILRALAGPNLERFGEIEAAFTEVDVQQLKTSAEAPVRPSDIQPAQRAHRPRLFKAELQPGYREKCRKNGERVRPHPRYRCLEDGEGGEEGGGATSGSESDTTDGEMLLESEEEEEEEEGDIETETSGAVSQRYYIVDSQLPIIHDLTHHFMSTPTLCNLSKKKLKRSVCAMLNTCLPSTIYMGVSREGRVTGLRMNRKQRDVLLIELDNLMKAFSPTVKHDRYRVTFVPVAYNSPTQSAVVVQEYFVIELELLGLPYRAVHIMKERVCAGEKAGEMFERCYYRIGCSNEVVSRQELRDLIAQETCQQYGDTISNLENNIAKLGPRRTN